MFWLDEYKYHAYYHRFLFVDRKLFNLSLCTSAQKRDFCHAPETSVVLQQLVPDTYKANFTVHHLENSSPRIYAGLLDTRRVGKGNFTPSLSQNRTWQSPVIRLFSTDSTRKVASSSLLQKSSFVKVVIQIKDCQVKSFAPFPLQKLHRYYNFIRHQPMLLYFDLTGCPLVSFQFASSVGFSSSVSKPVYKSCCLYAEHQHWQYVS